MPRVRWVKAVGGNEEAELEQGPLSLEGPWREDGLQRNTRGSRTQLRQRLEEPEESCLMR